MDKRRHYIMVIDTETANVIVKKNGSLDMSNVLVYDCGWAVTDTKGNIYETASYVNSDIFDDCPNLMKNAYYAEKIPQYLRELSSGQRVMLNTYQIRQTMLDTLDKWNIKEVAAHNARFDYNALNITQRWTTYSKYRYWFPFDKVEIWDTLKCARSVIGKMPTYKRFCEENGYMTQNNRVRLNAETLYRFISGNNEFKESHTGLEDVLIEAQILAYCYRQHKAMKKKLFENKTEYPPLTDFQVNLQESLKKKPSFNWSVQNNSLEDELIETGIWDEDLPF